MLALIKPIIASQRALSSSNCTNNVNAWMACYLGAVGHVRSSEQTWETFQNAEHAGLGLCGTCDS